MAVHAPVVIVGARATSAYAFARVKAELALICRPAQRRPRGLRPGAPRPVCLLVSSCILAHALDLQISSEPVALVWILQSSVCMRIHYACP